MSETRIPHSRAWWQAHLQRIDQEGIGTKAYADREGLSVRRLYDKRKEFKQQAALDRTSYRAAGVNASFVAVEVLSQEPMASAQEAVGCALVLPTGVRMEMAALPSPEWLTALATHLSQRGR